MEHPEIPFNSLSKKQFEELVFDLLDLNKKFFNVNWRNGSWDGGRDITAQSHEIDSSDFNSVKNWHVDAKSYQTGIPFSAIEPTLAHASANKPDYLLLAVYPYLTPSCKDDVESWLNSRGRPFQVRYWENPKLVELALQYPDILRKHLPEAWSEQLQMDAYLRELQTVLDSFTARVEVIWSTVEKRPFTDALFIKATNNALANRKGAHIEAMEKVTSLSAVQRSVITSALAAEAKLQKFLRKAFNLPNTVLLYVYPWTSHPDLWIVHQVTHATVFRDDVRRCFERLLGNLDNKEHLDWLRHNGVITMNGTWKPYDEQKNVLRIYAFAPVAGTALPAE